MSNHVIDLGAYPHIPHAHNKETLQLDPKTFWSYQSRMAIQVIRTDEDQKPGQFATHIRHPWTDELVASGADYDKLRHFMPAHETDPWLDALVHRVGIRSSGLPMVYGRMTVHGSGKKGKKAAAAWFRGVVGEPLVKRQAHGVYDKATKTRFRAIFYWGDDDIEALLVPMDSNIHDLSDLGIHLSGDPKAPKRIKRSMAPHKLMLEFSVVKNEQTPDGVLYTLRHAMLDREVTVLSFDMSRLSPDLVRVVDGMNVVNLFARLFGREWDHIKFTAVLSEGLGKGYGHTVSQVEPDVVLYGTKQELRIEEGKAYLGVLGLLGMGDAKMDIQTGANMGFFSPELAPAEGEYWMKEIQRVRFSENESAIRDMDAIFARLDDQKAEKKNIFEPEDQQASVRAAKLMLENQSMPVLWRRSIQRSLENTIDTTRGRILMTRVMKRLDLSPNLLAFTRTGRPDASLDQLTHASFPHVPEDMHIVCCWDMDEGQMFLVRNPNTTSQEAILVHNVHLQELKRYRGRGIVFFSVAACELLVRLNGADFDDSALATTDPWYIAKWLTRTYPVTEKLSVAGTKTTYPAVWNRTLGDRDITRWTCSSENVGGLVNDIMLDTLLSGSNRAHAIHSTQSGIYWVPENFSGGDPHVFVKTQVLPYLEVFKQDYVNAFEANNSEYGIDWCAMRKGDEAVAKKLFAGVKRVMTYEDATGTVRPIPCFPKTWDMDGKCRIPVDRKAKGDYLLVETEVCQSLNRLTALRDSILEQARQKEWAIARPIPTELDFEFPTTDFTKPAVDQLRKTWRGLIEHVKEQHDGRLPKGWYQTVANGKDVQEEIASLAPDYNRAKADEARAKGHAVEHQFRSVHIEGLKEHYFYTQGSEGQIVPVPLNNRIGLAVEWLRQVYAVNTDEPILNEDGTTRGFGDGVPDYILHDYMTALEMCQLTGLVVYVKLDDRARRRLVANGVYIDVRVVTGQVNTWVIDHENGLKLGTLAKHVQVPDGAYLMSPQGVIVVQESDLSLRSCFKAEQVAKRADGIVDEVGADFQDDNDPYAA